MNNLEQLYPSLARFSDINWEAVTKEYESTSIEISFPEYLQLKAEEGDCPPYLFELAYYEMALASARTSDEPLPYRPGIYLNPTALFLALQFDVIGMLESASRGKVEVLEKDHVLCLFRGEGDKVKSLEVDQEELELLQFLENGPQFDVSFVDEKHQGQYQNLVQQGLILDLLST